MTSLLAVAGEFAGGLGLFLLGMGLMTEGLRLAAGRALAGILGRWTRTRFRGLLAGVLVTSLVQSSSAVTVATIGFVNAGLLTLAQAIWVIFGSNVGTTMTGWLVALVGFNLKIEILALPLIGFGTLLRLSGAGQRRGALGTALAGFGLFFFGIDILRDGFARLGADFDLATLDSGGPGGTLLFALIGVLLTTLMQSSSAALAVALTAAAGGLMPLTAAAAVVVGANVGTTSTALLAVLGATPNARRTAAAHVVFNLMTGVVALLILPWLLALIELLRAALELPAAPATTLALFHTSFNLLGVLLIWPFSARLVVFLEARFRTAEEDEARPHYLDDNVLAVPALALDALTREVQRIGGIALRMARAALSAEQGPTRTFAADKQTVDRLTVALGEFSSRLYRANLSRESAERLPAILRVARYYDTAAELAAEIGAAQAELVPPAAPLADEIAVFRLAAVRLFERADTAQLQFTPDTCAQALREIEERYAPLKAALLVAGSQGTISVVAMENWLVQLSRTRRLAQQV
ncbi:MAG TPA: Na/Pi symporter, partial [Acidiferrobacterales bacterium]|nr:Na/Pi symporter [Acidiferrobacterales bacterium]